MENDGWTIRTRDHKPSAHYEHQLIITETGTEVISTYKLLGEVIGTEELY
jgi:methionyl aminopeptidase